MSECGRFMTLHQSDDSESIATSSVSCATYEDEVQMQTITEEPMTVLEPRQSELTQNRMNTDEVMKNEDLQMMFENYKQLGGELEYLLKLIETQRLSLNNIYLKINQEYDILSQQKEFLKKNLIDIQIQLETLDMERLASWKRNQEDKKAKLELINDGLKSVYENDSYIKNTKEQFEKVLTSDREEYNSFLMATEKEVEFHSKAGEDYNAEMKQLQLRFENMMKGNFEDEKKITDEVEAGIAQCKAELGVEVSRLNEIESIRSSIQALSQENSLLNTTSTEVKNQWKNMTSKYAETSALLETAREEFNEKYKEMQIKTKEYCDKTERLNVIMLEKKDILESLKSNNLNLKSQSDNFSLEIENLNKELTAMRKNIEFQQMEYDLEVKSNSELLEEASQLDSLIIKLKNVEEEETVVEEVGASVAVRLSELTLEGERLDHEMMDSELRTEEEQLRNLRLGHSHLEQQELQALAAFEKVKIDFENAKNNRNNEFSTAKAINEELKEKQLQLEKQVDELKNELSTLNSEGDLLNTELSTVNTTEVDLGKTLIELETMNSEIAAQEAEYCRISEEIENVEQQLTEYPKMEELTSEIAKVELLKEEAATSHYKRIDDIKTSFEQQIKNMDERIARSKVDADATLMRNRSGMKKRTDKLPGMRSARDEFERNVKGLLPAVISQLNEGLDSLLHLAKKHKHLLLTPKKHSDLTRANRLRMLTSIEEHLAYPMKRMSPLEGMPKQNTLLPDYEQVLNEFKKKYITLLENMNEIPPVQMAAKVQEMAGCIFGKQQRMLTSQDSEVSSSTTDYFALH